MPIIQQHPALRDAYFSIFMLILSFLNIFYSYLSIEKKKKSNQNTNSLTGYSYTNHPFPTHCPSMFYLSEFQCVWTSVLVRQAKKPTHFTDQNSRLGWYKSWSLLIIRKDWISTMDGCQKRLNYKLSIQTRMRWKFHGATSRSVISTYCTSRCSQWLG